MYFMKAAFEAYLIRHVKFLKEVMKECMVYFEHNLSTV